MNKRTKALQFTEKIALEIVERDQGCIFCKQGYHMHGTDSLAYQVTDIMHIVNKSQSGLGIHRNGALGCRYHHHLLDNGNEGLRKEMIQILHEYMKGLYEDWNLEDLVYKKY